MKIKKISLISMIALTVISCGNIENNIVKNPVNTETYINKAKFTTQVRVSERMNVDITYPSDKNGDFIKSQSPYPVILFVQGGFVSKERYQWLADHFAGKGFVVLSPEHMFDLAFFQIDNSYLSLNSLIDTNNPKIKGLVSKDSKVVIMGHSLGGVVSIYEWLKYDNINGLILLASYPDSKSDVKLKAGKPVLSITGSNDKKALPEVVKKGFNLFGSPKVYAEVKGMNHYAWTDNFTETELKSDGKIEGNLQDIRNNALNVMDTWLNANIFNEQNAVKMIKENNFSGVQASNE